MSPFGPIRKSRHVRFSTAYEGRPDVRQTRIGERARNKKAVMEDGNEGDCLGEQSRLADLARAYVGHEHTNKASRHGHGPECANRSSKNGSIACLSSGIARVRVSALR